MKLNETSLNPSERGTYQRRGKFWLLNFSDTNLFGGKAILGSNLDNSYL